MGREYSIAQVVQSGKKTGEKKNQSKRNQGCKVPAVLVHISGEFLNILYGLGRNWVENTSCG